MTRRPPQRSQGRRLGGDLVEGPAYRGRLLLSYLVFFLFWIPFEPFLAGINAINLFLLLDLMMVH